MKTLTTTAISLVLAAATITTITNPASAQQAGDIGFCTFVGESTIIWGGSSPNIPGANGKAWSIKVIGPNFSQTVYSNQQYFQFPKYTCTAKGGAFSWSTMAPASNFSIAFNASPPMGGYWPPDYTPLPVNTGPSQTDKNAYESRAEKAAAVGAGFALLSIGTFLSPPVAAGFAAASAAALVYSGANQFLAADPPRTDYTLIANPKNMLPKIPLPSGLPLCWTTFAKQEAWAIAYADAAVLTVDRISGAARAVQAGNLTARSWLTAQNNYYNQLKPQLTTMQNNLQTALTTWSKTCRPLNTRTTTTAAQVLQAERRYFSAGLSTIMQTALAKLDVNAEQARETLYAVSPQDVATELNSNFTLP